MNRLCSGRRSAVLIAAAALALRLAYLGVQGTPKALIGDAAEYDTYAHCA